MGHSEIVLQPMGQGKRPQITVLYGSQTGTAADVAERVSREAWRRHFPVKVCSMDDYAIDSLIHESYVVCVAATTGQGEEPDNMKRFWKFLLRRNLPRDSLSGVQFAVFGLGDSSYPKFNYVAKKLQKRLEQLGGTVLLGLGLADDQHEMGIDGALDPWLEKLWTNVLVRAPIPPGLEIIPSTQLAAPKLRLKILDASAADVCMPNASDSTNESDSEQVGVPTQARPFMAPVVFNRRVTSSDHFQDVRHIRFDIRSSGIVYSAGDVVNLLPSNAPDAVAELLTILNVSGDTGIEVEAPSDADVPAYFMHHGGRRARTLRDVLTHYLDIAAVPRRYFFEVLAHFATVPREAERLQELSSAAGQDDLLSYCHRVKRTSIEALRDFPSLHGGAIDVAYLFDLFRPLQARAFSISSSQAVDANYIDVTAAIVNYNTRMATPRVGVCTSWMSRLLPGPAGPGAPLWVTRGTFKLPPCDVPLIMIGPGTGCAPFIACLHERIAQQKDSTNASLNVYVFGNRNKDGDFLHQDVVEAWEQQNKLTLITAFSRDQPHKIYVQHRMREHGALLASLLVDRHAVCLVAGYVVPLLRVGPVSGIVVPPAPDSVGSRARAAVSTHPSGALSVVMVTGRCRVSCRNSKRMPVDVREALCDVITTHSPVLHADGYVRELERTRRLQFETW
eukprot:m.1534404 g.1534404  ORF g.1534404 m.1534404 type:complete len:675 (-) comp25243_c0_seq43:5814-7838(-)